MKICQVIITLCRLESLSWKHLNVYVCKIGPSTTTTQRPNLCKRTFFDFHAIRWILQDLQESLSTKSLRSAFAYLYFYDQIIDVSVWSWNWKNRHVLEIAGCYENFYNVRIKDIMCGIVGGLLMCILLTGVFYVD